MNVVILSYRISGNDGVSLECIHWKEILEGLGHKVTLLTGQLDRGGVVMPELHFHWPKVTQIHDKVVYGKGSYRQIEEKVFDLAGTIEGKLRFFFNGQKKVDLLIVANVLSLPMHFPLAVALSRVIEELNISTIARHHDFWWERERYLKSQLFPFFVRWFPPRITQIKHVVINSISQKELKKQTGIDSSVIWDSFDFSGKITQKLDTYSKKFRSDFGFSQKDIIFLQPTRIVPRKRIEISVEFIKKLAIPNAVLVISGHSGDEGTEYLEKLKKLCKLSGIRHKFIGKYVNSKRRIIRLANGNGGKIKRVYTMWDCYRNCDFVIYPTEKEGFGNQFVESVYFKKPIILTPYEVYEMDIKPLGFKTLEISEKIKSNEVETVRKLIKDNTKIKQIVDNNYNLGKKYLSYKWVERKLSYILPDK